MSLQRNIRVGGVLTTGVVLLFALAPFGMCQNALVQEVEPGVDPLPWTVYRLCDHEMFHQAFCIKSYTQGENTLLGAVISTGG